MRRLSDIHMQRGMLLERIATQRYFVAAEIRPVQTTLDRVDEARVCFRTGIERVKRHPLLVGISVAVLATLNFRRALRLAQRSFFVWRTWRTLQQRFMFF